MAETGPAGLHGDFLACDRFDVRERLAQIGVPTLVIGGTADRMTPLRLSQSLAERIPGARLQVIQDAGHTMALERPDEVAAAVRQFIGELHLFKKLG